MKLPQVGRARSALLVSSMLLAAAGLAGCGAFSDSDEDQLAVAVYGGPTTKTWQESFGEPFSDEHSEVKLSISGVPNPSSLLYTQEGDVQFDLILATASDVAQLAAGDDSRYTPIDPSDLDRSENVIPEMVATNDDGKWVGAPVALTYYGVVVNTDEQDPKSVTSWADLADPAFKGEYLMNGPSFFATTDLPMFALANGGSDTDLDPGIELLRKTIPNVKSVITNLANAASMVEGGDATIAPFFFSQYSQLLDSGVPVEMVLPKEGGYASPLYLVVAPGTEHEEEALEFIDSTLATDQQEGVQDASAYMPVVDDAKLIEKLQERSGFPSVQALIKKLIFPDYGYLAEHREENTKRIEDILAD